MRHTNGIKASGCCQRTVWVESNSVHRSAVPLLLKQASPHLDVPQPPGHVIAGSCLGQRLQGIISDGGQRLRRIISDGGQGHGRNDEAHQVSTHGVESNPGKAVSMTCQSPQHLTFAVEQMQHGVES